MYTGRIVKEVDGELEVKYSGEPDSCYIMTSEVITDIKSLRGSWL